MPVCGPRDMIVPNATTNGVENDPLKAMIILHGPYICRRLSECRHDRSGKVQVAMDQVQPRFLACIAVVIQLSLLRFTHLLADLVFNLRRHVGL